MNTFVRRGLAIVSAVAVASLALVGVGSPGSAQPAPIVPVPTAVAAFVGVVGTPSQADAVAGSAMFSYEDFTRSYPAASPEMKNSAIGFFDVGGNEIGVYPASSNSPADLVAAVATTLVPVNGERVANSIVVPALSSLTGDDYYQVAIEMSRMSAVLPAMAILDVPASVTLSAIESKDMRGPIEVAITLTRMLPSPSTAALYGSPLSNPASGATPAAGLMAGLYLTNDELFGVWSAPSGAGLPLVDYTPMWLPTNEQMDDLSSFGINSFTDGSGVGATQAAGAQTLEQDNQQKRYINEVRLAQNISASVRDGLAWTVFEPAGQQLWGQVNSSVSLFLATLQAEGAFGDGPLQTASFVTVGQSNNSVADMAAGLVNIDIAYRSNEYADEYLEVHVTVQAGKGL